jgi:Zn ribbon nucleic-acid-binding protein
MECPKCGYQDEIQLIDAKTEKTVFCHNCKCQIKLYDNEASVHSGIDSMNNAIAVSR